MGADGSPTLIDLAREARFTLGALEVRPSTREVVQGERREVLEPRVMRVLVALAQRRGEVVSRDELTAACWGVRVVGEDAINRAIAGVRRVAQSYGDFAVETVARVGHRLTTELAGRPSVMAPVADPPLPLPAAGSLAVFRQEAAALATRGPQTDPKAAWSGIEASIDPRDYADFLEVFAQSELAFEARRRRRKLDDWASADQTDLAAVTAFLRSSGSFAGLQAVVQRTADKLAAAAERTRRLSLAASAGLTPADARAAALAKRDVLTRSFAIYLPDIAAWPRPVIVAIPPGRFMMGSPENEGRQYLHSYNGQEEPQHEVKIDYVFAIGVSAVTVDVFSVFIADTNYDMGEGAVVLTNDKWEYVRGRGWRDPGFAQAGNHPVTCVSWVDAQAFIAWLNGRLGLRGQPDAYRLPSEAEWEYACRAGTQTPFNFGSTITTDQANYNGNVGYGGAEPSMVWRKATTPVFMFPPNAFGLHDMHGNVWEWCEDAAPRPGEGVTYEGAPTDGSAWLREGARLRIFRGGCWDNAPEYCRSARRIGIHFKNRGNATGFRLARTLPPPDARSASATCWA
jgi:formylglycine-generating enzyme required for sulfatase activity/DNA-binding winged helix-turn-helix (wHTH) protein